LEEDYKTNILNSEELLFKLEFDSITNNKNDKDHNNAAKTPL